MYDKLEGKRVGFVVCGSFCTFAPAFEQMKKLVAIGCDVTPIMSFNASSIDTRFGKARAHIDMLEGITGKEVIRTIVDAEPIGPKGLLDIVVVALCTGNTLAKLATGIVDTPATMAVKSHIRNLRPVVIAIATNDALSGAAKNIGILQNYKHYFFVPMAQDDYENKPNSMIALFDLIPDTAQAAFEGRQLQPLIR